MNNSDKGSIAAAFITGAAVGMAAAFLVAPKSGKETREDIKRNLVDTKNKINETVSSGNEAAKIKLNEAVNTTKTVAREGKRAAKEAKDRVKKQQTNDDEEEPEQQ